MERFSLTQLIVRRWPIILVLTLLVFGAALLENGHKAPKFSGSLTVTVQATRKYPTTQQLILQASQTQDLQTAMATSQAWLADPFYVRKALETAGVATDTLSLDDYAKTFQVVAPVALSSSYQVQFVGTSADQVTSVFTALRGVLNNAKTTYDQSQGDLSIDLSYTEPTVTDQASGLPLVPIAGLAVGLVFGFVIAALYDRGVKA